MRTDIASKALLYAIPLFLAPFVDKLANLLLNDQWPTLPKLAGCILLGTVSCSIGLRAFFDGSYERSKSDSVSDSVTVSQSHSEQQTKAATPPQVPVETVLSSASDALNKPTPK
jgi:hypothetical protein